MNPSAPLTGTSDTIASMEDLVRQIVHLYARSWTTTQERDDMFADGLIAVWHAVDSYRPEMEVSLRTWCGIKAKYAMLERRKVDVRHKRRRIPTCSMDCGLFDRRGDTLAEQLHHPAPPHDCQLASADSVRQMLRPLPARERHVMHRYYVDGWMQRDIGTELGLSESRVSQLISAALETLRESVSSEQLAVSRKGALT